MASTDDHANQYPKVAIGPASEKWRFHPSLAYIESPPDLSGNMAAGSAYTYAWSAPTTAEENQMIEAHLGPSVTTEPASPASRKPGFASAMMNPSHHRMVFSSCGCSTASSAINASSPEGPPPARSRPPPRGDGAMMAVAACARKTGRGTCPAMGIPVVIRCECGAETRGDAGETFVCGQCGRRYET